MQTLWFLKMRTDQWEDVVWLLTAPDEESAKAAGMDRISDWARPKFTVVQCEAICQTPDTVDFEPV